ncbi:MAG: hypothetical protein QOG14_306 [Mycobacterium sp.]|nr:hypothetical protein [Mycobacterium sp.]
MCADSNWQSPGREMRWSDLFFRLLYPDRCRLRVRIHGRLRSDRKRRFLLSAVAFSTSTRHPREAKPINWAQRGGLACRPGNCVLTPRPHFTAPSCTLGNREVCASDGAPFRQARRPTRVCRTPEAGSGLLAAPHRHSRTRRVRATDHRGERRATAPRCGSPGDSRRRSIALQQPLRARR